MSEAGGLISRGCVRLIKKPGMILVEYYFMPIKFWGLVSLNE